MALPLGNDDNCTVILEARVAVSIVSDNRLDDWGSIPSRGKGFFL
jgi:hypothetical protein